MSESISVQPEWCLSLPIQQQSVLFLAARGPDGIKKRHLLGYSGEVVSEQ